jgi:fluoroquinolone transport system permease protein
MNAFQILRRIGPFDLKNVRRDSLLVWMVIMPLFLAGVLRWAAPQIVDLVQTQMGMDWSPYVGPIVGGYFFVLFTPVLFGIVIGFLLLDERDDRTLLALRVTPMPMASYLAYRLTLPLTLSFLMTLVVFPLFGLVEVNLANIVLPALVAALEAPIFALYLASFGKNKVEGFALMKASGPLLILPMVAYFVSTPWEYLFAVLPTYWPIKLYWSFIEPGMHGSPIIWAVGAVIWHVALIALLLRRFNTVMNELQ